MYKITQKTMAEAFRPFDIVRSVKKPECIGMIAEVDLNNCQSDPIHQVSYRIQWFVGNLHNAWFDNNELEYVDNVMETIAKTMCHPLGSSSKHVRSLMYHIRRRK